MPSYAALVDHDGHLRALQDQSARFLQALEGVPHEAEVPSCPGWTAADLLWHLAEVQQSWTLVAHGADLEDHEEPPRPPDEQFHSIRVRVTRAGHRVRARHGYVATAERRFRRQR